MFYFLEWGLDLGAVLGYMDAPAAGINLQAQAFVVEKEEFEAFLCILGTWKMGASWTVSWGTCVH